MESISVHELKKIMEKNNNSILIDVREPDELKGGAIPGAQNIPIGEINELVDSLKKYDVAYINCGSGGRSSRVCNTLIEHSLTAVNVDGGFNAWQEAGFEVSIPKDNSNS